MPRSPFTESFNKFFHKMIWYNDFSAKIAKLKRGVLTSDEKQEILEASVLKVYVNWEILVHNLLVECLKQDTSQYAKHKNCRVRANLSRSMCENLISGGADYFNFTDISDVRGKARKILVPQYNPFDNKHEEIKRVKDDLIKIDEFRFMRNYLAHYSNSSKQKLFEVYKNKFKLNKFCEPGKFLSALDKHHKHIRFVDYTRSFFNVADAMAEVLKVT